MHIHKHAQPVDYEHAAKHKGGAAAQPGRQSTRWQAVYQVAGRQSTRWQALGDEMGRKRRGARTHAALPARKHTHAHKTSRASSEAHTCAADTRSLSTMPELDRRVLMNWSKRSRSLASARCSRMRGAVLEVAHACTHLCARVQVCAQVWGCMCAQICTYMHACVCGCTSTHIHVHVCVCVAAHQQWRLHICASSVMRTHMHVQCRAQTHARLVSCAHTYKHTHTRVRAVILTCTMVAPMDHTTQNTNVASSSCGSVMRGLSPMTMSSSWHSCVIILRLLTPTVSFGLRTCARRTWQCAQAQQVGNQAGVGGRHEVRLPGGAEQDVCVRSR